MTTLPARPAVRRVYEALAAAGLQPQIVHHAESTRTASEAAAAIGTEVAQIVKSLVFATRGGAVVVLASGINRVDTGKLAAIVGEKVARADADLVRRTTGFAIGGVPPLGYSTALPVYVDRDLLNFDTVWAAAGTPFDVFPIAPLELVRVSGGSVLDLRQD